MSAAALAIVIASLVLVGAAVAAMAVGVMFKRPCLRGSCGGAAVRGAQGEHLSCSNCPNRKPRMGGRPPPQ
ncbi:MAG: hypothetical protein JNJ89_02565 [Rubrivivax sp.]|nr:hypothetical protein [Rubrivivax sp.]